MLSRPAPTAIACPRLADFTGDSIEEVSQDWLDHLYFRQGKVPAIASPHDWYMALAYAVRDRLLQRWICSIESYLFQPDSKIVCYLSAEFLIGPQLEQHLLNLHLEGVAQAAARSLGLDLEPILDQEEEPGLGNGGLGRLAACFLESLATLEIPAIGFGIRYEFGIFDQGIRDGWQVELTDKWLRLGNPWELARHERTISVRLGGSTYAYHDEQGHYRVRWIPQRVVLGIPYDMPVVGYHVNTANTLRLWRAEAVESFDFEAFNQGDYYGAVDEKIVSENITKVLYPNDTTWAGKRLRLEQQYFFVSCSLQDMLHLYRSYGLPWEQFPDRFAFQLNDTHPSVAIPELMRLLLDDERPSWETAWAITERTFAYTNHTLLPEALERWPVRLFAEVLPRHLEIIYEINHRFLNQVRMRYPGDEERLRRLSLIDEEGDRSIRMAHLACVGSHRINGVSRLHTELLCQSLLRDFHEFWPGKFLGITNGVSPRRWIGVANPPLRQLLNRYLPAEWLTDLEQLQHLEPLATNADFRDTWSRVKRRAKLRLCRYAAHHQQLHLDPDSLFDVQVKRIHEYKRQHLNLLRVIAEYERIKTDSHYQPAPRTILFGGKAAPGYAMAKLIIRLIHGVAQMINRDPQVCDRLRVAFLTDYNVKLGELIYPAADLSEQISTAGQEASGTGNMKLALNGALTIGTLDGANVEIREAVGDDGFFRFGLDSEQVHQTLAQGYCPWERLEGEPRLASALSLIEQGHFSSGDRELFQLLVSNLRHWDPYLVLSDFNSYLEAQQRVDTAYQQPDEWQRRSILTTARMGAFSSDRAIRSYGCEIWGCCPLPIRLSPH